MLEFTFMPNTNEVLVHLSDTQVGKYDATELIKALGQAHIQASFQETLTVVDAEEYKYVE